ncbi:glycosyltransferase family 2 protein [Algoriphagus sp.]|uniref:glycosyltransferase family 2 protein n=1 Tax=Algoriphagus sp. TaxID=1872435 RepID=UPI0025E6690F|nr:glycosyltransferase family 2 protein [Algoriphagus sp.]
MEVAILLTCFNRKAKTKACLENLRTQNIPAEFSFRVFICDDGSSDGTSEMLKKDFPDVCVVKGNGKLFWGGGMSKAWKLAKETAQFDYYLWLNDDTFLLPDALSALFSEYKSIGRTAILTAACKEPGTFKFTYGGLMDEYIPLIPNGELQEVRFINGNLVLIPKEIEEKIGVISSLYTHYLGDFDYGLRALRAGFPCFTTSKYLAECESNPFPNWSDPNLPLRKRWKIAHDVKGRAVSEYISFKSYHYGKIVGFKSLIDIYLKLFFTDSYVDFRNKILNKT